MLRETPEVWKQFLEFAKKQCSPTAFANWLAPIEVTHASEEEITLEVPNIFVKEYLISNYSSDLTAFLPVDAQGKPALEFVIKKREKTPTKPTPAASTPASQKPAPAFQAKLNKNYRFDTFIEGPANRFVKSAATGVAQHPGHSYNPLFIWGGVGLGKTHILHSIGHYIQSHQRNLRCQCITTEAFINDLVDNLRMKSVDRMKRFYRSDVDVLLVDDIQFLQNRLNFEEEFCNTFEALLNQGKQIVITSDNPPSNLKLSERLVGRMEWGLVVNIGVPELETRVAILQHKAEQRGLVIPQATAFFIAERMQNNIRQLEGAVNRLSAHCRLLDKQVDLQLAEAILGDLFQEGSYERISVEEILKGVATAFQVRVRDITGPSRTKEIALARQVAMYLARRLTEESWIYLAQAFGKTHSTLLHAYQNVEKRLQSDSHLQGQIELISKHLSHSTTQGNSLLQSVSA